MCTHRFKQRKGTKGSPGFPEAELATGAPKTRGEASFFSKWELDRLKRLKKKMEENDIFWEKILLFSFHMHGLLFFFFFFERWSSVLLFVQYSICESDYDSNQISISRNVLFSNVN